MSNALTIYNDELNKPANLMQFERMLGKRGAASFISGILTSIKENPMLAECPPDNIFSEALKGAAYNLPIGGSFGMSWLVPRYSSKHRCQMASWQPGYKGLKQMAMRSRDHVVINVGPLFDGQSIDVDQLTGSVQIVGDNNGGDPIGYFGYLRKVNGYEGFVYWTMARILEHKTKYAKGADRKDSPWNTNPEDMYKKTVLTNLLKEHATLEFDLDDFVGEKYEETESDHDNGDQLTDEVPQGTVIEGNFMPRDWGDRPQAIVDAGLEENALIATDVLNRSALSETASAGTCVNWYRHYRKTVDEFGFEDQAIVCADEAYENAKKAHGQN